MVLLYAQTFVPVQQVSSGGEKQNNEHFSISTCLQILRYLLITGRLKQNNVMKMFAFLCQLQADVVFSALTYARYSVDRRSIFCV